MPDYSITASNAGVDFAPATLREEIIQNVATFLGTRKGTVPLDRDFGLDWDFVDAPYQVTRAQLMQRVADGLARYEPRAVVTSIEVNDDPLTGKMQPTVRVRFNGD